MPVGEAGWEAVRETLNGKRRDHGSNHREIERLKEELTRKAWLIAEVVHESLESQRDLSK